jgi:crotonobetainyl-CoA:carnitine CoA-transferase CaiB-like acyl-CoA transferase
MRDAARPLSHIRVLDFGQYLAGPLVGMTLADLGAEVIRIDPPGGPRWQTPAADMLSRGKSSLVVDLKTTEGRTTVLELCRRSDLVIENFRPGVMRRLGLGPDDLRSVNPSLVSLSLPGFASSDADLADIPAWEAVIAARTGQFTDMGLNRRLMGVNPSFTPLGLASAYGAAFGTMAVLFALTARERLGGDHIEVPLAAALFEGLAYNSEQIEDYPERYKSPREVELDRREALRLPMNLRFEDLSELLDPFYRTYTCRDGRGFYVVACSIAGHPRRALETLGLGELADELPNFDPYLDQKDWPDEWSMGNYPVGARDCTRIAEAMKAAFLTRTSHEWEELFGAARAPATAQRTTQEWLADPHALASGLVLEVEDAHHGSMRQMGNVIWLADDPAATMKRSGPTPDDARPRLDAILSEEPRLSVTATTTGGWLDGVKVLDLTNVIAGPTIGSTLARFGADVTLVQPVEPTVDPWNAVVFGLHAHRGKKSVLLDLKTPAGQEAFYKLVAHSHVLTLNCTDEQREHLGLSQERLDDLNPDLVVVQLDAFGGPNRGPKSDHLGYDDLAQAATGVMLRFGGGMDTPEEHAHFGTIDVLAGLCGAAALAAARESHRKSGRATIARTSLAAAGNLIQAEFMYDYEGRAPFDEPSGREVLGAGPFYRCYQAADGWVFFAAPNERHTALQRVPELADLAGLDDPELEQRLIERFKDHPCSHWVDALTHGSSTVVPLSTLSATRDTATQLGSTGNIDLREATFRVIRHDQHPMGRWIDLVAPNTIRPRTARISVPGPMPRYGEHTRSILQRMGYSPDTVEKMMEAGAASDAWDGRFLPE